MSLTTSYLISTRNFEGIMNSILAARAPERFTNKFLEDLGYKSSNDRLIIGMLKALGLIGDAGEPTQRYYDFLDQTQSKKVISIGIQEAYEDLFNLRRDAQNMSQDEVKNKLKTLTQGSKGEKVIDNMARTFKTLCDYADWSEITAEPHRDYTLQPEEPSSFPQTQTRIAPTASQATSVGLHYNIQIHLPETTNMAVYDAIFQSLKKHLL